MSRARLRKPPGERVTGCGPAHRAKPSRRYTGRAFRSTRLLQAVLQKLLHADVYACCSIQEPLEVKAGEPIVRKLAEVSREGGDCRRIASFELGERLHVACYRRGRLLIGRQ